MPRQCSICAHKECLEINKALIEGLPYRRIAAQFGVSDPALRRHKEAHLPVSLVKAEAARGVADADALLAQVQALGRRAISLLEAAEASGDLRAAVAALREVRSNLELLGRTTGELAAAQKQGQGLGGSGSFPAILEVVEERRKQLEEKRMRGAVLKLVGAELEELDGQELVMIETYEDDDVGERVSGGNRLTFNATLLPDLIEVLQSFKIEARPELEVVGSSSDEQ